MSPESTKFYLQLRNLMIETLENSNLTDEDYCVMLEAMKRAEGYLGQTVLKKFPVPKEAAVHILQHVPLLQREAKVATTIGLATLFAWPDLLPDIEAKGDT